MTSLLLKDNTKRTIAFGFGAVIVLVILLVMVTMTRVYSVKTSFEDVVETHNVKIELATTMRDAIRQRKVSLYTLINTDDPFEIDEELLRFYDYAGTYRQAREAMEKYKQDKQEKTITEKLIKQTKVSQPITKAIAEQITESLQFNLIKTDLDIAMDSQEVVLGLLNELINHNKTQSRLAVVNAQQEYNAMLKFTIALASMIVLISIGIALFVGRYVTKQNAALAHATKAKSNFLATMSHEIRTPLTSIIGFGETLLDPGSTPHNKDSSINAIVRNGKHLLKIINDILDISKIEAGKIELDHVETSLFELTRDLQETIEPHANKKGLAFKLNYQYPLPPIIETDPVYLKQILINLCNNAIKFTENGYICLGALFDPSTNKIAFTIQDTGIGMTEEQQNKIFQAFAQADSSTTRRYGGTGLGLYLSKQFAELLGGDISLESQPHQGSVFTVSISAGDISANELIHHTPRLQAEHMTNNAVKNNISLTGKVLLAEDNPDNQALLNLYISRTGADVVIVPNGEEAIKEAQKTSFDLILMDKQMPVMDGMEAVRELRHAGYKRPIVALTANATQQDRDECILAGCDDFLSKPIDKIRFMEVLQHYLPSSDEGANYDEHLSKIKSSNHFG